jgi:hypothetical protein
MRLTANKIIGIQCAYRGGMTAERRAALVSIVAAIPTITAPIEVHCDLVNSPLFRVACVKKRNRPVTVSDCSKLSRGRSSSVKGLRLACALYD